MAQTQSAEEKARLKKQWTDLAIKQAQTSEWEEAVLTNKNILNLFPGEIEAYNRLGKAYSELGSTVRRASLINKRWFITRKTSSPRKIWIVWNS